MKNDIAWKLQVKLAQLQVKQTKLQENCWKRKKEIIILQAKYTCYHFAIIAMGNLYFYDLMNTLQGDKK